jgi:hypothetical protein
MSATDLCNLTDDQLRSIFHRAAHTHAKDFFIYNFAVALLYASPKELCLIRGAALLIIEEHQLNL